MFMNVVAVFLLIQMVFAQLTIPIGRKCGCMDMQIQNPQIPLVATNGYQNAHQANPLLGNVGLLMSNGLNSPVTNALLNAIQLSRLPITSNVQFSSTTVPCQGGTAGVSVAPNMQAINFGNVGGIATLANVANVGSMPNIANVGSLTNSLQFVPNTGNVPVRLRRNIQKNFGGLCNSAITYDSTLLGLY